MSHGSAGEDLNKDVRFRHFAAIPDNDTSGQEARDSKKRTDLLRNSDSYIRYSKSVARLLREQRNTPTIVAAAGTFELGQHPRRAAYTKLLPELKPADLRPLTQFLGPVANPVNRPGLRTQPWFDWLQPVEYPPKPDNKKTDALIKRKNGSNEKTSNQTDIAMKSKKRKLSEPKVYKEIPADFDRNYDGMAYKSDNPDIRVLPVCSFSIYCDVFLHCLDKDSDKCVIPLHKKFLCENVPYIEAMCRDSSNWRENIKAGEKKPDSDVSERIATDDREKNFSGFDINEPSTSKRWDNLLPVLPPSEPKETSSTTISTLKDNVDVLVSEDHKEDDRSQPFCPELTRLYRAEELSTYFIILYSSNEIVKDTVMNISKLDRIKLYRLSSYLMDIQLCEYLQQYISSDIDLSCMAELWGIKEYNFQPAIIKALSQIITLTQWATSEISDELDSFICSIVKNRTGAEVGHFMNQLMTLTLHKKWIFKGMGQFVGSRTLDEIKEMVANVDFIKLNDRLFGESKEEMLAGKRQLFNSIVQRFKKEGVESGIIDVYSSIYKELPASEVIEIT